MKEFTSIDELCINTLRMLSIDAVQKANSGHPGLPLDAAPMGYVLWSRFLKCNPTNPSWFDRDRFVLSAGHGSMLLYSLLYLMGFPMPLDQIKQFRQWDSMTPGHPEREPGVEVTTGPLGQGFGNGVGLAIAEAYLAARFNRPDFNIIDHYTYSIVSDGDIMEGVAAEAASLAGHLKLGKLIYLYDSNHITLSAATQLTFTEDYLKRFQAYGWHTDSVSDGNDPMAIDRAIKSAQNEKDRPSLIAIRTHIGYGSPKHDSFEAHGSPLGEESVKQTKQFYKWPAEPAFYVPKEVEECRRQFVEKGKKAEADWNAKFAAYEKKYPNEARELRQMINDELPSDWIKSIPTFPPDAKGMATRVASGKVLAAIAAKLPELIGGSADLNPSTHTELKGLGDFENPQMFHGDTQGSAGGGWSYAGRNIHYGVREHGMGAISNGIAAHGGLIPFAATFLCFSDYMRPAIRLSALSKLQVVYIFTHDSVGLGEDGPTHQPIEHVASLRAIPRLLVIRPGDANEAAEAWKVVLNAQDRPTALILSRQNVPTLDRKLFAPASGLLKGSYVLYDPPNQKPEVILIATGSELGLIVAANEKLKEQKIAARLVSMPCWELFDEQPREYRESVLPPNIPLRLAVEAGSSQGWHKYVGDRGEVIGIDNRFGASAPGELVLNKLGFNVDNVCKHVLTMSKR